MTGHSNHRVERDRSTCLLIFVYKGGAPSQLKKASREKSLKVVRGNSFNEGLDARIKGKGIGKSHAKRPSSISRGMNGGRRKIGALKGKSPRRRNLRRRVFSVLERTTFTTSGRIRYEESLGLKHRFTQYLSKTARPFSSPQ